jgi:Na+/H+ antiporter NhaD/arsenite permease-like protein
MVWQAEYAEFFDFFKLFVPSLVNYGIPAAVMYFAVPTNSLKKPTKKLCGYENKVLLLSVLCFVDYFNRC